jgi:hypothetical protein
VKRWLLHAALLLSSACVSRCGCGADDDLAELSGLSGAEIDRDHAASTGTWLSAAVGDRFQVGDGLRTGGTSSADLELLPSGRAHVEPRTVLRFLANAPENPNRQVSVETGAITIVAQNIDLEIHTPRAIARVPRGAKLKLVAQEGRERFDVLVGKVVVAHEGVLTTVEQAEPLSLEGSPARAALTKTNPVATRGPDGVPSAATDTAAEALAPPTPVPAAAQSESQRGAERVPVGSTGVDDPAPSGKAPRTLVPGPNLSSRPRELSLPALESAIVHVAKPPLSVYLPAPCDDRARIVVDGATVPSDNEGAVAFLNAGAHTIRTQCGSETRQVRLVVKRDAAKMDLPKRAQNVRVEADGRRYTVRYQNLLPEVTFVWPGSHTPPLRLLVKKGARENSYNVERPEHALASGMLGEGEYKFSFRDARGSTSASTTLRLSFDNTARSAYLSAPADDTTANAGTDGIEVAGAALSRSRVQIQGHSIQLDDKGRFRGHAQLRPGETSVAVRVEHPESGVHYYVRRVR